MLGDVKEATYLNVRQEQMWEGQTGVCKAELCGNVDWKK